MPLRSILWPKIKNKRALMATFHFHVFIFGFDDKRNLCICDCVCVYVQYVCVCVCEGVCVRVCDFAR